MDKLAAREAGSLRVEERCADLRHCSRYLAASFLKSAQLAPSRPEGNCYLAPGAPRQNQWRRMERRTEFHYRTCMAKATASDITGVSVKGDGKRHFYLKPGRYPEEAVFDH